MVICDGTGRKASPSKAPGSLHIWACVPAYKAAEIRCTQLYACACERVCAGVQHRQLMDGGCACVHAHTRARTHAFIIVCMRACVSLTVGWLRYPQEPTKILGHTRNTRFCDHKQRYVRCAGARAPRARSGPLAARPDCPSFGCFSPGNQSPFNSSPPRRVHLSLSLPLSLLPLFAQLCRSTGELFSSSSPSLCPTYPAFFPLPRLRYAHAHAELGDCRQDLAQELQRETCIPTDIQHIVSVADGKRLDKISAHTRLQDLRLQNGDQLQVWQYGADNVNPRRLPSPHTPCRCLQLSLLYLLANPSALTSRMYLRSPCLLAAVPIILLIATFQVSAHSIKVTVLLSLPLIRPFHTPSLPLTCQSRTQPLYSHLETLLPLLPSSRHSFLT